MIYIGIVGSRHRDELIRIHALIIKKENEYGEITIVSGGATGIDDNAYDMCMKLGVPILVIPPKRYEYHIKGNDIFFERNKLIAIKSNELHAYPQNRRGGTMNTVRHFRELGKKDKLFIYD